MCSYRPFGVHTSTNCTLCHLLHTGEKIKYTLHEDICSITIVYSSITIDKYPDLVDLQSGCLATQGLGCCFLGYVIFMGKFPVSAKKMVDTQTTRKIFFIQCATVHKY